MTATYKLVSLIGKKGLSFNIPFRHFSRTGDHSVDDYLGFLKNAMENGFSKSINLLELETDNLQDEMNDSSEEQIDEKEEDIRVKLETEINQIDFIEMDVEIQENKIPIKPEVV